MNRNERLFAIAEDVRSAGTRGRTTTELAREFGVSQRTIKRDMASLQRSGLPLLALEGRGGGYQALQQSHLAPVPFTAAEAAALVVAVASQPHIPFSHEGRSALAKLHSAMAPDQRALADNTARRVWMRDSNEPARPPNATMIDDALRLQMAVAIAYADVDGNETRRTIEPMAYVRTSGHWSVLAWCQLRDEGRWFRLDRIRRAWPTNTPCTPRDVAAIFGEPPADAMPAISVSPQG